MTAPKPTLHEAFPLSGGRDVAIIHDDTHGWQLVIGDVHMSAADLGVLKTAVGALEYAITHDDTDLGGTP